MTTEIAKTESENPFAPAQTSAEEHSTALTQAVGQREAQEVQAAMIVAKKFPRDERAAIDRIIKACGRPSLAQAATYEYRRGSSSISGPSIRLAECMAQNWGNLDFGIRELDQRDGESTVETFCWDQETNTRYRKVFCVSHTRHTRQGSKRLVDPRDIYEMVANQGSRRLRACILGVIPGDVVELAVSECDKTLKTSIEMTPEKIKALIGKFSDLGVGQVQIEKWLQRNLESITPVQMVRLGKIYNSIQDGVSKPGDWFETDEQTTSTMEEAKKALAKPKNVGMQKS